MPDPSPTYQSLRFSEITAFVWSVADLLRGDYKQSEYGRVVLPFTVLRRLDCVLEPTRGAVRERYVQLRESGLQNIEPVLNKAAGPSFHNTSQRSFERVWPKSVRRPGCGDAQPQAAASRRARTVFGHTLPAPSLVPEP